MCLSVPLSLYLSLSPPPLPQATHRALVRAAETFGTYSRATLEVMHRAENSTGGSRRSSANSSFKALGGARWRCVHVCVCMCMCMCVCVRARVRVHERRRHTQNRAGRDPTPSALQTHASQHTSSQHTHHTHMQGREREREREIRGATRTHKRIKW